MRDLKRTLKDEGAAAQALLASIRAAIGDDDQATLDAIEGETALLEAVDASLNRLAEIETLRDSIGELITSYRERSDRLDNQAEQIRAALCMAMSMAGVKKLERPAGTLSLRAMAAKAIVTSEADLPSRFFVEQAPKLDKKAVLEALRAGEKIAGAELSNGGETISIRRN
jgi:hypothetical protein